MIRGGDLFWLALFGIIYRYTEAENKWIIAYILVFGAIQALLGFNMGMIAMVVTLILWRVIWDIFTMGR